MKGFIVCLATVLTLAACGGGGDDDTALLGERLAAAPRASADLSQCSSSSAGYLQVGGECLKKLELPTPQSVAPVATSSAESEGGPKRAIAVTPTALFNYAQLAYPFFFGGYYTESYVYLPGYGTFFYRYYYGTGNYLGVLEGVVYVYGPASGWYVTPVGRLEDFFCAIYGCTVTRSFITWTNSGNGVVVKDANNEDFAFYSDSRCIYSYARQQETTNFCLSSGRAYGYFAGVYVQVMLARSTIGGCIAVLADYHGRQVDIYTNTAGIQIVSPQSSYWSTTGCTY